MSRHRWLLAAPAVAFIVVVVGWLLTRTVWLSMHDYSLADPSKRAFNSGVHYLELATSRTWWSAVAVTLLFVVVVVVLQLLLASGFVGVLIRLRALGPLVPVVMMVPFALMSVASFTIWRDAITDGFGAQWFGYAEGSQAALLVALVLAEVWRGTGVTAVILLAGRRRVSARLLEAARADGASGRQRLWRVVLPAMSPAIAVAVMFRGLDALRSLDGPLVMTQHDRFVTSLTWGTAFGPFELGLAAAMSIGLLILAALLAAVIRVGLRMKRVV